MNKLIEIFRHKRVLVTGDTGFKGSWLSLWLHKLGAEVTGFSLPPNSSHDHYSVIGLENMIKHIDGDIRDVAALEKVFQESKPEFLFHLAAQPLVRASYGDPKQTFDVNVGGSVNILEVARHTPSLKSIIYVTTDKVYKNREWMWGYRENDELGGHDPYSASKAAAEIVLGAYSKSFFSSLNAGVASVRAGNVIGGGDWAADRIVPDCIRAFIEKEIVTLRNPHSTRPWQHVLDPLYGYLLLAIKLFENPKNYSGSWNFGPSSVSSYSVLDLVKGLIKGWGEGEFAITQDELAPHEANLLHLNCEKARQILGWEPQWEFQETVEQTILWYKETARSDSALSESNRQIDKYMKGIV